MASSTDSEFKDDGERKVLVAMMIDTVKGIAKQYCVRIVTARPLTDTNSGPALVEEWKLKVEEVIRQELTNLTKAFILEEESSGETYIDPDPAQVANPSPRMVLCQASIEFCVTWTHGLLEKFYAEQIELAEGDNMKITTADNAAEEVKKGPITYGAQHLAETFEKLALKGGEGADGGS